MKCKKCGAEVGRDGVCPSCGEISLMSAADEVVKFETLEEERPKVRKRVDESAFTELVMPEKTEPKPAEPTKNPTAKPAKRAKSKTSGNKGGSLKNCLWFAPASVIVLVIVAEVFRALSNKIDAVPGASLGYVYYGFVRTFLPTMIQVAVCYLLYRIALRNQPKRYIQAALPTCVVPYAAYLFTSYAVGSFQGVFTYAFAGIMAEKASNSAEAVQLAVIASQAVLGVVQILIGLFASVLFLNSYYRRLQKILDGKEIVKEPKAKK